MKALIEKYNKNIPRYTSYPPVPFWGQCPKEEEWINHVKISYDKKMGLDLYIHVPFCEKLCFYCGCNRMITKNHNMEDEFLVLVKKQWANYITKLGFTPKIHSVHMGGGTPTFLSPENIDDLLSTLITDKSHDFYGSIEIDPRTVKTEHLDVFKKHQVKRISLGIQDFDPKVQQSINRLQSFELVENVVNEIRNRNFESINFDVIYGLPNQTKETITNTFKLIEKLSPDLMAYYSYAHLPEKIKNQKLIKEDELPKAEDKKSLYELGKSLLNDLGFEDIGMDHFAKSENYLYEAKIKGDLHRNFMGYTDKKSNVLIGLGPTAISDSSLSFVQNTKNYADYKYMIESDSLSITSGHELNLEEKEAQKIILNIMCNEESLIDFKDLPYLEDVKNELKEMQQDELLTLSENALKVSPLGKTYLRNIAAVFDYHLREKSKNIHFSKSL